MDIFANNLAVLRKSKGLTIDEVASSLGVSRQAFWSWENGQRSPSLTSAIAVSRFFGVDLDDLACRPLTLAAVPA